MKGFLLFLVVALWFGVKLRNMYRKQMSELENGSADTDQGTVRSAFESLFDESVQFEGEKKASSTFASEAASAGYYSYETSSSATDRRATANTAMSAQSVRAARPAPVLSEADATAFDLRQAIIYQTILDNKYLSDTQSTIIN